MSAQNIAEVGQELKPCPFCGAKAKLSHSYHEDDHRYPREFWHVRVACLACEMADTGWRQYGNQEQEVANVHVRQNAEAEVIAAWNRRAVNSHADLLAASKDALAHMPEPLDDHDGSPSARRYRNLADAIARANPEAL